MDFGESHFSRDFIEYLLSHSVMFGGTFFIGQRSLPQRGVPLHPAGDGELLDPGEPAHVHRVSQLRGGQVLQVTRHWGLRQ